MKLVLGVALLVACTRENPAASCAGDGNCPDPAFGFCDVDGVVSGVPDACIALDCTPGEVVACRGENTLVCNATGDDLDEVPCSVGGCVAAPSPHCPYLEPVYLPDVCDARAELPLLAVANSSSFDTDFDPNCTGGIVVQAGGPQICVVRYRSIRIESGVEFSVTGSRALAFVADDELIVDGVLDVSATGIVNGPGGGLTISGTREGNVTGGGGAGFKTPGGGGGDASSDGGAANGGPASQDPALIPVLSGGTRSQAITVDVDNAGGAGGAATLISCRGTVSVTGTLDAGGGGGSRGFFFLVPVGGCGGGSGGYVVLQGLDVSVTGQVFANGGGGGGGRPSNADAGLHGSDGPRSGTPAAGGLSTNAGEGSGGSGGSIISPPTNGKRSTTATASAGGGGGSIGFFQSYTPPGIEPMLAPTNASPPFEANREVKTR